MLIHELAAESSVPAKTIRYYESIWLMPPPSRGANNYRRYTPADAERLRFIASARSLGFSLADITDMLNAIDTGAAPCRRVLEALDQHLAEIDRRIADMLKLRAVLAQLHDKGALLPQDDVEGKECVCYLITTYRERGQVVIHREGATDD